MSNQIITTMDKYELLKNEILQLINEDAESFAWSMIKWYGYKSLKTNGELSEIKKLMLKERLI